MPRENPIVIAVRHGRTVLNEKTPRLRAWENAPLDSNGILDAKVAAQSIKHYRPQIGYSSDLTRDFQTMQIISQELGNIPYEVDFDLRTADMGELTGMEESKTRPIVDRWYKESWTHAPGGGESLDGFLSRFYRCFDLKVNLAKNSPAYQPTVIVSHGRNLAALHARSEMIPQWEALMPLPGGAAILYLDDRNDLKLDFLSSTEPIQSDR